MARVVRRSAPGVKRGRVQKKNRHGLTEDIWDLPPGGVAIVREKPGPGSRHLLKKREVQAFLDLLPDRGTLLKEVRAVVLAREDDDRDGWYLDGVVALVAWSRPLWQDTDRDWYVDHEELLGRLNVDVEHDAGDSSTVLIKWTLEQAKAYQLLHVLLHELGHHHDALTNRSGVSVRGEDYAEGWAFRNEAEVWERYTSAFGLP